MRRRSRRLRAVSRVRQLQPGMGQPRDLLRIVADENDHAAGEDLELDQLLGERRGLRVESGGRLVEQQHAGLVGNGPDQPEALTLAGRQLRDMGRSSRADSSPTAESRRSSLAVAGKVLARAVRPTRRARPRHSARGGATPGPASRGAPRLRDRRSRRRHRGRRWRATAASCRSRTGPRWPGTRAPQPRRRAAASPPTDR